MARRLGTIAWHIGRRGNLLFALLLLPGFFVLIYPIQVYVEEEDPISAAVAAFGATLLLSVLLVSLAVGLASGGMRKRTQKMATHWSPRLQEYRAKVVEGPLSPERYEALRAHWGPLLRGEHHAQIVLLGSNVAVNHMYATVTAALLMTIVAGVFQVWALAFVGVGVLASLTILAVFAWRHVWANQREARSMLETALEEAEREETVLLAALGRKPMPADAFGAKAEAPTYRPFAGH